MHCRISIKNGMLSDYAIKHAILWTLEISNL